MAANETPLGAPGGGGPAGPRSATAATFQVSDSSLRSMSKVWKELTKDVGDFNRALIALDKGAASVDKLHAKLAGLGIGGAGTTTGSSSSSGSTTTQSTTTRVQTPGQPAGASTTTQSSMMGGGHGGGGGRFTAAMQNRGVQGALGVAYAAGGYYKRSMGDISDLDLMYTQSTLSNGGFSQNRYRGNISTLQGYGGYQSASDLMGGVSSVQGALGAGLGNARTNRALQATGQLAALNPSAGFQGSAAAVASLYAPATQSRLRSLGAAPGGSRGQLMTPQAIYQQIQRLVFRGQKVTADMIGEGMQPGAPLYRTLVGLGLDANAMEQFRMYALVQANLGGSSTRTDKALSDAAAGRHTADTRRAGLDSIRQRQNEAGGANVRRTTEAMDEGRDALMSGFTGLAKATDALTKTFAGLNHVTGGASGGAFALSSFLPGSAGGASGALSGIGQSMFNYGMIRGTVSGGMGGGGGIRGRLLGGLKGGLKGGAGMSGLQGTPVFVTNWPGGGGFGGGGGGGGVEDMLGDGGGRAAEEGMSDAERAAARRGGRFRQFGRGIGSAGRTPFSAFGRAGSFGRGAGLLGSTGTGMEGMTAMEAAGAGIAGGAVLAAPFAVATYAGLKIHGQMVSNEVTKQESSGQTADSLTKMLHRWNTEGFNQIPEAHKEWQSKVKPLILAAGRESKPEKRADANTRAVHELAQLMNKYSSQLNKNQTAQGRTGSGAVMWGAGANVTQAPMSYSTGQPGGAAAGESGGGNAATTTKPSAQSSSVNGIIATAESFLGKPYKWGGSNPRTSFDCSGLMQWSFGQNGIKLPRTAKEQQKVGTDVPLDQLVPGDLVFYGSPAHHVAMYIGGGQMVEAPHTGANIRNTKLRKPTNAKRVAGGGAAYHGSASASTEDAQKGDSGTQATGGASANLSGLGSTGASSELESLARFLTPPTLFGGGGGGGGRSGAGGGGTKRGGTTSQSAGTPTGPPPGGTVGGWVKQALGLMHLDFDKYAPGIASIIQHESGGNPRAQNNWDSNAKAGHPSKGLMQTIDSTFNRWAMPGHHDIWNPVDNIIAGTRYAIGRYGTLDNVPGIKSMRGGGGYKGYATGSYDTAEGLAYLHNDEMVVPAGTARKVRSMLARQGQRPSGSGAAPTMSMGGGGGVRDVKLHCPITVVGKATAKDATDFLGMVRDQIEQDHALDSVGSG